jgi:endoglucanase
MTKFSRAAASAVALGCALGLAASIAAAGDPQGLRYGVYDPEQRFADSNRIAVEHVFVRWQPHDGARLRGAADYAASRNRWLMVTVEPWPAHGRTGETLFADIVEGTYDPDIANMCSALGALGRPVFVRWGHEMEDPTGRYPWARDDAEGFVKAYRYFVDHCRPWSHDRFFFVWSPKGMRRMSAYYPGAEYADYVGVSVYGLEHWETDRFGKPRDFSERFREIYGFASQFKKPVMIAEAGVAGDAAYRHHWFSQRARASDAFPLLRMVVCFNAEDPEPWTGGYGNPDWRIDPADLK